MRGRKLGAHSMGSGDDYKFMEIRDAIVAINMKVNLIGVIIEFGFPRRTKGTGIVPLYLFHFVA